MGWKAYIKLNQWTEKFFYQILPDFVKKLDDQTPFISASPCGTGYMQGSTAMMRATRTCGRSGTACSP